MKFFLTILSLIVISFSTCFSQAGTPIQNNKKFHPIEYFTDGNQGEPEIVARYQYLYQQLIKKKDKLTSDHKLTRYLFNLVHRKQLATYKNYVSMEETLGKSRYYDCVTGTALYALLLHDLQIDFTIKEFDYHVFLIAHLDDHDVLFESTDPFNGYVVNEAEISSRVQFYLNGNTAELNVTQPVGVSASHSDSKTGINNDISLIDLAGLQYYNIALKCLNSQDLINAQVYIKKAHALYPSERIKAVQDLIWELQKESTLAIR